MQDLLETVRRVLSSKEISGLLAAFFGGLAVVILGSVSGDSQRSLFHSLGVIFIATCSGVILLILLLHFGLDEELGVVVSFIGGILYRSFYGVLAKLGKSVERMDIETLLSFIRRGDKK